MGVGFHITYRKILKVKAGMMKIDGHARNPDAVVKELIEFWKKHQSRA